MVTSPRFTRLQKFSLRFLIVLFGIIITVVGVMFASLVVSVYHLELGLNHVLIIVLVCAGLGTFLTAMLLETLE